LNKERAVVAVLRFRFVGQRVTAWLHDSGEWTATDSTAAAILNATLDPTQEQGPQYGAFGAAVVAEAVKKYRAAILYQRPAENVPGCVY
jgi:hypothetical protein